MDNQKRSLEEMITILDKEIKSYMKVLKKEVLKDPSNLGKYVVVKDEKVFGIFAGFEEGYQAARKQYGPKAVFLEREIVIKEPERAETFLITS